MTTENDLPEKPLVTGKITLDSEGNISGIVGGWNAIKVAQRTFQEKYCSSCGHYDKKKGDFKIKGHLGTGDANDCFYHWTDPLGQCHNYHENIIPPKNQKRNFWYWLRRLIFLE